MLRAAVLLTISVGALSYAPPFVAANRFTVTPRASNFGFLTLRGGHADWPKHLHVTASGSTTEPDTKEAAQKQRSYIQELSNGAKTRSAIPGLQTPEVEDQTPRNPLTKDSRVLVVGATRGIGLEFVRQVLDKGARVVATHRGSAPAELRALQESAGADRLALAAMDVSDEDSVRAAAQHCKELDGFTPLSHVIHSAGVYGPRVSLDGQARFGRPAGPPVTAADMINVFKVNTVGPLLVAQHFLPLLRNPAPDAAAGVIGILTSKVASVDDNTSGGAYAYRASKAALNVVAKSLKCDAHPDANVVLLHPGYVKTDMTGGQGLIEAAESVAGMLRAVEATDSDREFRFVDYKACLIPW